MRAVIQVSDGASVSVKNPATGEYDETGAFEGHGLVVLLAATHDDGPEQVETMVRKIAELRVLPGELSASDANAPVLVISQFTLYGNTKKGRRPSWIAAAPGEIAEPLVDAVIAGLRARDLSVGTGKFGAMMRVSLTNDGPCTLLVEC
ncbi:MAG: D-aminoacyl-tRNA deacylase [Varibaculum sp.]|nr:D-aminoacyl-tRNA deacylase [Varibaculum sp.]